MNKYLSFICALGAGTFVSAQPSSPEVREFLQSPTFMKSILAGYDVLPDVQPRPSNEEIAKIGEINAQGLLNSEDLAQTELAAQLLSQFLDVQKAANIKTTGVIEQVVGSIYFRLASLAKEEESIKRYQQNALKFLNLAIDAYPNYRQAHKNLALLNFQIGDEKSVDLALKHFSKSIELGNREPASFILMAKLYFDKDLFVASETAARQAIMIAPEIKEARTILAYALFQQSRYEEAQSVFEELLEQDPNKSDIWLMISNTFIQKDQVDEAAKRLEIVRLMGEADYKTMGLLGDVYVNKGMVEDAKTAYSEGLKLAVEEGAIALTNLPDFLRSVETLNNFEAYELSRDLLNEIEAGFQSVLTNDEKNNLLAIRSEINIALGADELAVENLKDILNIDPLNSRALLSLGRYYGGLRPSDDKKRLEAVELALIYYRRAQELINRGAKGDREATHQAFIGEGQLLARERRLREAIDALEEAQSIQPEQRIEDYIEMIRRVIQS